MKALHGDMSQGSRDGVMIAFKGGRERLLVATDVAARGLDISGVSTSINYDMPNSPDIYVHRIGRTGRVGALGPRDHADHAEAARATSRRSSATRRPRSSPGARTASAAARKAEREAAGEPQTSARPAGRVTPSRAARRTCPTSKLIVCAGRARGSSRPTSSARSSDNTHLEGEDIRNVRVLERFSFVEVPADRAQEVVDKVSGKQVRGAPAPSWR